MLVAACMRRLPKSIARKGPQAKAPSLYARAVPKSTGTAAAVRLNGLASRNHSAKKVLREFASLTRSQSYLCGTGFWGTGGIINRVGPGCCEQVRFMGRFVVETAVVEADRSKGFA